MICKTCGNELRETDTACDICGTEVPHYDAADVGVTDSAGSKTDEVSDEKMWPWDPSKTAPVMTGDSPAAHEPAEAPAQAEPPLPTFEAEPPGKAEQPAAGNDAMFKTGRPVSGNKEHFDFKWISEDFHNEDKPAPKEIKFDWGDLFGEKKPEPEQPEEPEPPAIKNIVIEDPADDEKSGGSIFGEDFFTRQSNIRESYDFYNDTLREKQDAAEGDTSFEDAIKEESDFADVQEPTIRVSLDTEIPPRERAAGASFAATPPREAPFHYEPEQFEPGPLYTDTYNETPVREELKTGSVTPEQFEPGPLYADTYDETPVQEELKTGTVTPEQFEPGPLYADTYNETPVQEELKTGTVTPEQFEPGPLYADTYNETSVQEELKTGTVTPEQFERNPLYADAPLDSRSAVSEIGADPLMQIYENPKKTRAEDIPSKPFTSADIARLGIFDTNVASPFDNEAEDAGVVSPFDLTDASVASLFGSPDSDGNAAQMSFGTAVTKEEPVSDAESAAKESPTDGIPYYNKRDAAAELKQNQKIQEIISQPVIFPFDEDTGYVEPELEEDDYDDPEDETFTSAETVVEDIREPAEEYGDDDYDNGELTDSETARVPAAEYDDRDEYYPDKKASRKAAKEEKGKKKKKTQRAAAKDDEAGDTQMSPAKWLVILMDILVVVAVLVIAAFAILKLAPDSGVAHILDQGVTKVAELFSGSDSSADDSGGSSSANDDFIAPMPNKEALVNAQAGFNNRNIAEVVYDPNAGYDSNRTYTIKGISGAKPIENDYWTTDDKGYVLYDEAAVAAVIRFNSELVSYISGQQSEIISLLETGSKEETALSNYASSVTALEFRKLGIGEILTDGTYFYVFTNETAAETRNGASIEINSSKVYKLAADPVVSEMKIVEIETVA